MVLPYVYRCTHKITKQFYIGSRCANKIYSSEDILIYRTSSKKVKPIFDEFNVEIIADFFSKNDAYEFEQTLIFESKNDPLMINTSCFYGKLKFFTYGRSHTVEAKEKIRAAVTGRKMSAANQIRLKKLNTGKKRSNAVKLKLSVAHKGKRWYNNGLVTKKCHIPPEGFVLGRLITDTFNNRHRKNVNVSTRTRKKVKEANTGNRWYTNGVITVKSREPIEGFQIGRIFKK